MQNNWRTIELVSMLKIFALGGSVLLFEIQHELKLGVSYFIALGIIGSALPAREIPCSQKTTHRLCRLL
jgi:hypothetical protein